MKLSTTPRAMTLALEIAGENLPERCEVLALLDEPGRWKGALIRYSNGMLRGKLKSGRWIGVDQGVCYHRLTSARGVGIPKNYSPEEREKRKERLAEARKKRWPKPEELNDPRR